MIDEISESRLERIADRMAGAYDKVLGSRFLCPDARLKEKLENLQEAIIDIQTYLEMIQNGDEEFVPVESSRKSLKSERTLGPDEMKSYYTYQYDTNLPKEKVFYYSRGYTSDNISELTDLVKNQLKFHSRINRLEFPTGEILDVEYDENMNPTFIPVKSSKVTVLEGTIL